MSTTVEGSKDAPSETNTLVPVEEMGLLDMAIVLAKNRLLVLGVPLLAALLSMTYAVLTPNIYTAGAKIILPQQNQSSAAALLAQVGGLVGGTAPVGRGPSDVYIAMLRSRTVADRLVDKFKIMERFSYTYRSQAVQRLDRVARVGITKEGVITVDVDDEDPKIAAAIANSYVEELFALTKTLAVTEAGQRRLFFEHQVIQAKENLAKAEIAARDSLSRGLVKVDDQGKAMVETSARLRAQIAAKEIQIGAMQNYASAENPDLKLAQRELSAMQRGLANLEGPGSLPLNPGSSGVGGMKSLALLREVKYNETLYELLAKQYEVAKIDEAKDSAVLQVLDRAIEPDRKSGPKRAIIVVFSVLIGASLGVLLSFIKEFLAGASADPGRTEKIKLLKRHLSSR